MKKKIKLFSTIASLCLAISLMAFGVWAAVNVTFTTSSTVSFTASSDVFGVFTAKVEDKGSAVKDSISVKRENVAGSTWVAAGSETTENVSALTGGGYTLGSDLSVAAVGDKFTFTYKFENKSPYKVSYTVTSTISEDVMTFNNASDVAIDTTDVVSSDKSGEINAGESKTWTMTVELKNVDIDSKTITVSFALALEKATTSE